LLLSTDQNINRFKQKTITGFCQAATLNLILRRCTKYYQLIVIGVCSDRGGAI